MKHGILKRGLAFLLAAAMGTGLAACGDSGNKGKKEEQKYFRANYIDSLPESFSNIGGPVTFVGDSIYYQAYDDDYNNGALYSYNLTTSEEKTYWKTERDSSNDPLAERINLNQFAIDADGSVYLYINSSQADASNFDQDFSDATFDDVLGFMMEQWGYQNQEDAEKDWDAYYKEEFSDESGNIDYAKVLMTWNAYQLPRIEKNMIKKIDASGNEQFSVDLSSGNADGNENSSCYDIKVDDQGNLYVLMNTWNDTSDEYYIKVLDESGKEKNRIKLSGYSSSLIALADGKIATAGWGDSGNYEVTVVDPNGGDGGEKIDFGQDYIETLQVLDEKNFLISENGTVYRYNLDTKEKEKFLSWMDCNISRNDVSSFGLLSDGNIAVFTQRYDSNDGKSKYEIAVVKEIDASEVANVKNLTLACINLDYDLEGKIIDFNKQHEDYHISVREYYDSNSEMEYMDAVNSYMTAMASDNDIDIVAFYSGNVYSNIVNFASKGLLIDLYELLESDAELNKSDFIQSFLSACEYSGKMVVVPNGISLQTVVGKQSDVGDEPGWTMQEMKALLDSKEQGTQLFYGKTRDWALEMCLNLGYKRFIDLENSTCDFNNQDFMDVLEIANLFPEEFEWNEDEDETVLMNTGKVLLAEYYLNDFEQIQMYTEIFNDKLTYIGYPTTEGNGAMIQLNTAYGITKNCEDKEAAWELIRQFLLPSDSENNQGYRYGLSLREDDFNRFCEEAMNEENSGGSWGWGNFNVDLKPATQEQVDEVKDLVANTTAVSGAMSLDMLNMIKEEAAAYFSGQRSAADVAEVIQSRIEVFINETK